MKKQILVPVFTSEKEPVDLNSNRFVKSRAPLRYSLDINWYDYSMSKEKFNMKYLEEDWIITSTILSKALYQICEFAAVSGIMSIEKNKKVATILALKETIRAVPHYYKNFNCYGFKEGICQVKDIASDFFQANNIINLIQSNEEDAWTYANVIHQRELQSILVNSYCEYPKGRLEWDVDSKKEFIDSNILNDNWSRTINYLLEKYKNDYVVLYSIQG